MAKPGNECILRPVTQDFVKTRKNGYFILILGTSVLSQKLSNAQPKEIELAQRNSQPLPCKNNRPASGSTTHFSRGITNTGKLELDGE
jgi:hypothetical protein